MSQDNEVLVRVSGVSKKFCRDLKKSLWYGVKDVASELLPFGRQKTGVGDQGSGVRDQESDNSPLTPDSRHLTPDSSSSLTPDTRLLTPDSSPSSLTPDTRLLTPDPGLRPGEFWANKDISFELRRGECIGLIGHNGAGKTTLLKMLNGLIKPDSGTIQMHGRVGALIALGAGFNPILTGRENIYIYGSVLGFSKKEIDRKINGIVDFAEIHEFIDAPVQSYSSGMQVRLGFAVASSMEPDILILDEVLAVGDNAFKVKCLKRIANLRRECATIFVSHEAFQVAKISSRVLWLDHGCVRMDTPDVQTALSEYELAGANKRTSSGTSSIASSTQLKLRINGKDVAYGGIAKVKADDPFSLEMSIPPLKTDPLYPDCKIMLSILDRAGVPVAAVRAGSDLSNAVVSSTKLSAGCAIKLLMPNLPLSDGIYQLRLSVGGQEADDYLFYAERAAELSVSAYGKTWYNNLLRAEWDVG